MKAQGNEKGVIKSGFERVADGWHVMKLLEGIGYLKNKEGEVMKTNKGDQKWKIPMAVDDEADDSHEIEYDAITQENDAGEQLFANVLGATGLFAKFAKAFPGEVSVFEDKVMNKVKTSLPGQFWRVKTEEGKPYKDKDGVMKTFINIVGFGPMSSSVEKLESELFPGKENKGAGKGAGKKEVAKAAVVEDEDF